MKKYIPDTRVYYKVLDDEVMISDKEKREAIKEKIVYLRRDCERDYRDDMWYYQRHGQIDKVREIAREWFDSGLYSRSILTYYYNEFVGLKGMLFLREPVPNGPTAYCFSMEQGCSRMWK